jgi:hypothetical protein
MRECRSLTVNFVEATLMRAESTMRRLGAVDGHAPLLGITSWTNYVLGSLRALLECIWESASAFT